MFGTLDVNAVAGSRVLFDNVQIRPANNSVSSDNPFLIDISYAEFIGGNPYAPTNGTYGSLTLTDSIFNNVEYMYIWYLADVQIERNIFLNSGGIKIGFGVDSTAIIRNNIFSRMTTGPAVYIWDGFDSSQAIVEFNSFMDVGTTALSLAGGVDGCAIIGTKNWWGTTDTS